MKTLEELVTMAHAFASALSDPDTVELALHKGSEPQSPILLALLRTKGRVDLVLQDLQRLTREKAAAKRGIEYLHEVPSTVPPEKRLVHNHLRLAPELGKNRFAAWFASPNDNTQMECNCYWVNFPHYRTRTKEIVPPELERLYFRSKNNRSKIKSGKRTQGRAQS